MSSPPPQFMPKKTKPVGSTNIVYFAIVIFIVGLICGIVWMLWRRRRRNRATGTISVCRYSSGGRRRKGLRVLGVPLADAVRNDPSSDGVPVPSLVRKCLDFITIYGLETEGIFRISAPKSRLDLLERMANEGRHDEISFNDPHEAAGLLKRFLRQIPDNILHEEKELFDAAANECQCVDICQCTAAIRLKELLLQLPAENFYLLAFVFRNVRLVIQEKNANKMSLPAIGILLHAMFDMSRSVVKIFITNASAHCSENGQNGTTKTMTTTTYLFDSVDIGPLSRSAVDES